LDETRYGNAAADDGYDTSSTTGMRLQVQ